MKPSERTYQILSRESYLEGGGNPPQGWKVLKSTSHDNFFATAYVHPESKQIVIAFRGTNPDKPEHLINDLQILLKKQPYFEKFALEFTREIEDHLKTQQVTKSWDNETKQADAFQISYTGHSLGGLLAQLTALQKGRKSVVFESPGVAEIVEKSPEKYQLDNIDIQIINTVPDLVNSVNRHIVPPQYIQIDQAKPLSNDISKLVLLLAGALYSVTGPSTLKSGWESLPNIMRFACKQIAFGLLTLVCHFGIRGLVESQSKTSFGLQFADVVSKLLHFHSMDTIDKSYRDHDGKPPRVEFDPNIANDIRREMTTLLAIDISDYKTLPHTFREIVAELDQPRPAHTLPQIGA